jgi:hypothetical protein
MPDARGALVDGSSVCHAVCHAVGDVSSSVDAGLKQQRRDFNEEGMQAPWGRREIGGKRC